MITTIVSTATITIIFTFFLIECIGVLICSHMCMAFAILEVTSPSETHGYTVRLKTAGGGGGWNWTGPGSEGRQKEEKKQRWQQHY